MNSRIHTRIQSWIEKTTGRQLLPNGYKINIWRRWRNEGRYRNPSNYGLGVFIFEKIFKILQKFLNFLASNWSYLMINLLQKLKWNMVRPLQGTILLLYDVIRGITVNLEKNSSVFSICSQGSPDVYSAFSQFQLTQRFETFDCRVVHQSLP